MDFKIDYTNVRLAFVNSDVYSVVSRAGCSDSFRGIKIVFNNENILIKKDSRYQNLQHSIFELMQKYLYDTYGIKSYIKIDVNSHDEDACVYETFFVKFVFYVDDPKLCNDYYDLVKDETFLENMTSFLQEDINKLWNELDHEIWNYIAFDISNNKDKFKNFVTELNDSHNESIFFVTSQDDDNIKVLMWNKSFDKHSILNYYRFLFKRYKKYEYHMVYIYNQSDYVYEDNSNGYYVSYGRL